MLDEVIHDLSKACRLTQEGHLDVAKTKLKELVFTYTIRADAEVTGCAWFQRLKPLALPIWRGPSDFVLRVSASH